MLDTKLYLIIFTFLRINIDTINLSPNQLPILIIIQNNLNTLNLELDLWLWYFLMEPRVISFEGLS